MERDRDIFAPAQEAARRALEKHDISTHRGTMGALLDKDLVKENAKLFLYLASIPLRIAGIYTILFATHPIETFKHVNLMNNKLEQTRVFKLLSREPQLPKSAP